MIKNWLKVYIYHIAKSKVYFALTVLSLAVGIALVLLSVTYYEEERAYDQWNPNKETLFVVEAQLDESVSWMKLPFYYGMELKAHSPHVEEVCFAANYYNHGVLFYKEQKKMYKGFLSVQSNFFEFVPFEFVRGNAKQAFSSPNSLVIRDTYAAYLFGAIDPVGERVRVEEEEYVVTGVYTLGDKRSSFQPNIIVNSMDQLARERQDEEYAGNYEMACWIKLSDPGKKANVEQLLNALLMEQYKRLAVEEGQTLEELLGEGGVRFVLHDLAGQRMMTDPYLNGTPEGAASVKQLYIMSALAVLILILSVFNYINLSIARMMGRGKEVGVRKALGASRFILMAQGMFEVLLTVGIAMSVSFVLIELSLPWLRVFLSSKMEFEFWKALPLLFLTLVVITLLAGSVPSSFAASFDVLHVLKGEIDRSRKGAGFKNAILVIQFAVACFFMIGAYIVYQQVAYMLHKDLGFKGEQVVRISYYPRGNREDKVKLYQTLKEEFITVKGVVDVTASAIRIGTANGASSSFMHNGNKVQATINAMDYNFLDVYGIEMAEGRMLSEDFASDSIDNVLLNETAVRQMKDPNILGREIIWNGDRYTVVGIVKDFNLYRLQADYPPMLFLSLKTVPWAASNIADISVKVDGDNIEQTLKDLERIWERRNLSDFPFAYSFVDKDFAATYAQTIQERNIFLVLNGIVIFIALFGLYSLATYTINGRLKEVAIRKVLGASTPELLRQLSMQYIVFCGLGFVVAVLPSYHFLRRWLNGYAFRIDIDLWPFVICLVVIVLLTAAIVLSKAYVATRLNVLRYIKYE